MVKFIFYKLLDWNIEGKFDPTIKKSVVIVVPHTSWHDFYIGAFTRKIIQVDINYIAKKELFKGPLGAYLKWMGGSPLDRTAKQNKVEAIAKLFQEKDEFIQSLEKQEAQLKVVMQELGFIRKAD